MAQTSFGQQATRVSGHMVTAFDNQGLCSLGGDMLCSSMFKHV